MRYVNVANIALALSSILSLLLIQATQTTLGNPAAAVAAKIAVNFAVTAMKSVISNLISKMHSKSTSGQVEVKVWMHTDSALQNGCGFHFHTHGYSGKSAQNYFPKEATHVCPDGKYSMRMTSQGAAYERSNDMGNNQVSSIEFAAFGWQDTLVKSLCFGLSAHTIVNGPRAFCVNAALLKACKERNDQWTDISLDESNIKFTKTTRGVEKITITQIEQLVDAYEAIGGNTNHPDAADMICDKIALVRGTDSDNLYTCRAEKFVWQVFGVVDQMVVSGDWERSDVNPRGCSRYEGSR